MPLVSSLNVHNVKSVTVEAEREYMSAGESSYTTRTITIETDHGQVEIILFSRFQKEEDEGPNMAFII